MSYKRRSVLALGAGGAIMAGLGGGTAAGRALSGIGDASSSHRTIEIGDARFFYTDTGGPGEVIVLLHPATGSGLIWEHQTAFFRRAGYRVIAYSRRGHFGSSAIDPVSPGTGAADLLSLVDSLRIYRFHLVGSAAGGFIVSDFALTAPDRLLSGTIASSFGGFSDPDYRRRLEELKPPGFNDLPASFRELGPHYRASDPAGKARWEELEAISQHGPRARQGTINRLGWDEISTVSTSMMIFTGGADLYMPPALMYEAASHFQQCVAHEFPRLGHSIYWEDPAIFNQTVLEFVASHPDR